MLKFLQSANYRAYLRPEFFLFFVLQTLPTQFFGNWKKNKIDFFQFYFFISIRLMQFSYVFFVLSFILLPG